MWKDQKQKGNKSCLSACTSQYRSVWFVHHTVWVLDFKIEHKGVDLPHAKRDELSAAAGYAIISAPKK